MLTQMQALNFRNAGRWFVLCCLPLLAGSCGKRAAIADMRCEYLTAPISVDTPSPRFTWTYEAADAFAQADWLRLYGILFGNETTAERMIREITSREG